MKCNSHGLPHHEFNDPNHVSLIDLVFTTVTPLEHHNQAELTFGVLCEAIRIPNKLLERLFNGSYDKLVLQSSCQAKA